MFGVKTTLRVIVLVQTTDKKDVEVNTLNGQRKLDAYLKWFPTLKTSWTKSSIQIMFPVPSIVKIDQQEFNTITICLFS